MHFNLDMHIGSRVGKPGSNDNVCMFGKTDVTWNGHIEGSGSTISPVLTIGSKLVYELKWDATDTIGDVVLRLGDNGDEREPNTDLIIMSKMGTTIVLDWDDTENMYKGNNLVATTGINTIFVVDVEFCFTVGFIPDTIIHYDFGILETGVQA